MAMLDKITALLAKAESTTNEHEADAFFTAAQRLATKHAIDLAMAQANGRAVKETPTSERVFIGEPGKKQNTRLMQLFYSITLANDVKMTTSPDATYVVVYGFASDIETIKGLYAHLSLQMVQSANAYLKTGAYKNETNWSTGKALDGRVARTNFYEAFTARVKERLVEAKRTEETASAPGTSIVLANKSGEVDDYYRDKVGKPGTFRSRQSSYSATARAAGTQAGSRARLGQSGIGGSTTALGR